MSLALRRRCFTERDYDIKAVTTIVKGISFSFSLSLNILEFFEVKGGYKILEGKVI